MLVITRRVAITRRIRACRDPKDDKFLELAIADVLLTGDRDLLVLHQFEGVDILSPRDFLDRP